MLEKTAPTFKSPIYLYLFGYQGNTSSYSGNENNRNLGVGHGGELMYLFPLSPSANGSSSHNFTKTEESISNLMLDLWTSFVINGCVAYSNSQFINFILNICIIYFFLSYNI